MRSTVAEPDDGLPMIPDTDALFALHQKRNELLRDLWDRQRRIAWRAGPHTGGAASNSSTTVSKGCRTAWWAFVVACRCRVLPTSGELTTKSSACPRPDGRSSNGCPAVQGLSRHAGSSTDLPNQPALFNSLIARDGAFGPTLVGNRTMNLPRLEEGSPSRRAGITTGAAHPWCGTGALLFDIRGLRRALRHGCRENETVLRHPRGTTLLSQGTDVGRWRADRSRDAGRNGLAVDRMDRDLPLPDAAMKVRIMTKSRDAVAGPHPVCAPRNRPARR